MAWTNWGFDGTINEAQWSQMAGLLGNGYVAAGNGDCVVTAVPGARSVSVAAGTLYGDGVVSVNSGAETVAMTTPVNGQWYLICLKREWSTNTASLRAVAGATTTTTTPTVAPTSFPTINTSPGVLTDQPIAWAWCNSANTTVVVFDLRLLPMRTQPVSVADVAKRDAKFPAPVQGQQVWRDDLGAVETYFGLYNSITNPGGRDVAGWYPNSRMGGLIPIRPTSVTIASGTGGVSALGTISVGGATAIYVNGCFTSEFANYRIIVSNISSTGESYLNWRLRSGGTDDTAGNYYFNGHQIIAGGGLATINTTATTGWGVGYANSTVNLTGVTVVEIYNPAASGARTGFHGKQSAAISTGTFIRDIGGWTINAGAFDGFSITVSAATLSTANIQIYGYND